MLLDKEKRNNAIFCAESVIKTEDDLEGVFKAINKDKVVFKAARIFDEHRQRVPDVPKENRTFEYYEYSEEARNRILYFFKTKKPQDIIRRNTVSVKYTCCPRCHSFSNHADWFIPVCGWDELIVKYADDIFAERLFEYATGERRQYGGQIRQELLGKIMYRQKSDMNEYQTARIKSTFYVDKNDFAMAGDNRLKMRCPECGMELKLEKESFRNFEYPMKSYHLYRDSGKWYYNNAIDVSYDVYEEGEKVIYSLFTWHMFPNIYGKMHVTKTASRICFNTKTGQTYLFRDFDIKTRKTPEACGTESPRLRNVTYGDSIVYMRYEQAAQDIVSAICRAKNVPNIEIKNISDGNNLFAAVIAVNKFAQYGEDFLLTYLSMYYRLLKKERTKLSKISSNSKLFQKYIKEYGITGKKHIRQCAANPLMAVIEKNFKEIGFKNGDNILSLCENNRWASKFVVHCMYANYWLSQQRNFVKDYSEIKSEAELAKKMKGCPYEIFNDAARGYADIKAAAELNDEEKRAIFKGTMKNIHDRINMINGTTSKLPYYIPYTKEELELNCQCGEYSFMLAKTSEELREVGDTMHICVGSYGDSAFKKYCNIVVMYDKHGVPAACIELQPEDKKLRLIQFKDYCNEEVTKQKIPTALLFLEKNKIIYNNCYDAERSGFFIEEAEGEYKKIENTDGYALFEKPDDFKKIFLCADDFGKGCENEIIKKILKQKDEPSQDYQMNGLFEY